MKNNCINISSLNIDKLQNWSIYKNSPLLIAGPCSAESETQLMETAEQLVKNNSIDIFRAGIWKARTNPSAFAGIGKPAIKWLVNVKETFNIPITTEVMNEEQVKIALDNGINILWIGARTTVNSFMINEIAQAIKKFGNVNDITIFIKNPIIPDINLWLGAIKRFNEVGINKIGAIHRGFSSSLPILYRNDPFWRIPIKLKCLIPNIPILCDPSHIAGDKKYLKEIAERAYKLGANGLMVEVHNNPLKALSDAKQQITPKQFKELITDLHRFKNNNEELSESSEKLNLLNEYRELIDILDENLLNTLSERLKVVKQIDKVKKELNLSPLQIERWNNMLQDRIKKGNSLGLATETITEIMELIHNISINLQK